MTFKSQYEHYDYSDDGQVLWTTETHWPDPRVQIGAISQLTTTLKFMPQIYVLPMRDPFNAAKAISTAANLTNNRVAMCVGVGWQKSEFDILGQKFENRGQRTDEILAIDADCVAHFALFPDIDEICAMLESGKNVVTTAGLLYPKYFGDELVERLERACKKGGVVEGDPSYHCSLFHANSFEQMAPEDDCHRYARCQWDCRCL